MKEKINVLIDYPISSDNSYKGLSFPQVLFNYLNSIEEVNMVTPNDKIDVCIVISADHITRDLTPPFSSKFIINYLGLRLSF